MHPTQDPNTPAWQAGRLPQPELARRFNCIRPPLDAETALREARRCFDCRHDVPCVRGCPTQIDIPRFIRQIAQGQPEDAARTILDSNIFGGLCARVCPVEVLCERLCICHTLHGRPIPIAQLQRFATDSLLAKGELPFARRPASSRRIAIVGAGPAGMAAAFELAYRGHWVEIFEKEAEPGGLDRYGLAQYKVDADFVRQEFDYLIQIGGITLHLGVSAIDATRLASLQTEFDAVLLAIGLGQIRRLALDGAGRPGVIDALTFIRQLKDRPLNEVPVGRDVIVVGAGNTAIDAATQARRLGAENVTIAYRGGRDRVRCTDREFDLAVADGCRWLFHTVPTATLGSDTDPCSPLRAVRLKQTAPDSSPETFDLPCDQLIPAVGQTAYDWLSKIEGLRLEENGTLWVHAVTRTTSLPGVFAAGDCVLRAKEVVHAVYEGKRAALAIDGWLYHARPAFWRGTSARPATPPS